MNIDLSNLKFKEINWDNAWDIADGIEFIPICLNWVSPEIIEEYSKNEFNNIKGYPKTGRRYYILRNGKRIYFREGDIVAKNKEGYLLFVK